MRTTNLLVRNAYCGDIPEVKKIADANRKTMGFILRPILESSMRANELLVAVADNRIVGFLRWHKRQDGWSIVYEICVDSAFRRNGIGKKLINYISKPVRLKCPTNNGANGFYEHIGFKFIGQEKAKKRFLNVWAWR